MKYLITRRVPILISTNAMQGMRRTVLSSTCIVVRSVPSRSK